MFLTDAEVVELTKKQRRPAQRRALNAMGVIHRVRPDGSLAVLRSHVEKLLGGAPAAKVAREQEPDWDAMPAKQPA